MKNNEWNVLDCIIKANTFSQYDFESNVGGADDIWKINIIRNNDVKNTFSLFNMSLCKEILSNTFALAKYNINSAPPLRNAVVVGNGFRIYYDEDISATDKDIRYVKRIFHQDFSPTYKIKITDIEQTKRLLLGDKEYFHKNSGKISNKSLDRSAVGIELVSVKGSYVKAKPVKKGGCWNKFAFYKI